MSYLNIDNLYKNHDILLFKECYAMEKIHGTSAKVFWKDGQVHFFAGGVDHANFVLLFDAWGLPSKFEVLGYPVVTVYGEAYGGKCQGMSKVYGKELKFIAFEVKIGDIWLNVPNAEQVARGLGFDFVHYAQVPTDIKTLNAHRDAVSIQAQKNGRGDTHIREGIVLRPLIELTKNNGERIIAKHKREEFKETKTSRELDPAKLKVLSDAEAIADEWVTEMRLAHVLQRFSPELEPGIEMMGDIIKEMIADVVREGSGEIVDSKETRKSIGKKTGVLFRKHLECNAGLR